MITNGGQMTTISSIIAIKQIYPIAFIPSSP